MKSNHLCIVNIDFFLGGNLNVIALVKYKSSSLTKILVSNF